MTDCPLERRAAKRAIGDHGRRAEKKTAKRMKGRLTPASGAMVGAKGDFALPKFLVENKSTNNASLSLKLEWLEKISKEAVCVGKEALLTIQFVKANGEPVNFGKWALIPESVLNEILEEHSRKG